MRAPDVARIASMVSGVKETCDRAISIARSLVISAGDGPAHVGASEARIARQNRATRCG
jgi:hypothetical protein